MNEEIGQKTNFANLSSAKWPTLYKFVNDNLVNKLVNNALVIIVSA